MTGLGPVGLLVPKFPRLRLGGRTLVMGILNVTPDSFSGDGLAVRDLDSIVARGVELVAAGADVL
ncbi:MAG: dihydropteroate synthase, partial [Chloroflexota bacterium]|nr:dihydropteroate synthase [Chloroflexota bacterium]